MTELRNRASYEYLTVAVTADATLDEQPVEIAVTQGQPTEDDWAAAAWLGDPGTTRQARIDPFTPPGVGMWAVHVRVTDFPEIPVLNAGSIFFD